MSNPRPSGWIWLWWLLGAGIGGALGGIAISPGISSVSNMLQLVVTTAASFGAGRLMQLLLSRVAQPPSDDLALHPFMSSTIVVLAGSYLHRLLERGAAREGVLLLLLPPFMALWLMRIHYRELGPYVRNRIWLTLLSAASALLAAGVVAAIAGEVPWHDLRTQAVVGAGVGMVYGALLLLWVLLLWTRDLSFDDQRELSEAELARLLEGYSELIGRDPVNAEWYFKRGQIRLHLGELSEALKDYEQALFLLPAVAQKAVVHYNVGVVYDRQGRPDDALQEYQLAYFLGAENQELRAMAHAARAALFLRQDKLEQAAAEVDQAIAAGLSEAYAANIQGALFYERGELEGALAAAETEIRLRPESWSGYWLRGLVALQRGERERGREDIDRALALPYERRLLPEMARDLEKLGLDPREFLPVDDIP